MRKSILFFVIAAGWSMSILAQNVGIGTNTPLSTLDVRGNHRLGGMSKFITYDSVSGKITWSGSNLFVPAPQYIMQHSASAEGLYYSGGQLEYRNQLGNPAFFTNWVNGNGYFANNLGIRNSTPAFPLSFDPGLGDKISLWSNSTNSYGFGIQGSLLQIHTDISAADIGFGYGSSSAFFETMRIKGNGNVGIGNNAPYSPLSFGNSFGEKISLFGNSANNYGFGVQDGLFQIHSNNIGSDIVIGSGSSGSFSEVMRIKGAGYVGIGTTTVRGKLSIESPDGISFPQLSLHQTSTGDYSRARFTNGNSTGTGRYWDIASYIDPTSNVNDRLSFYSPSAGDVLSLEGNGYVNIAKLKLNGSAGNAKQQIQSNGFGNAPTWVNKPEYFFFEQIVLMPLVSGAYQDVSNVNDQLFTINFPCTLIVTFSGKVYRDVGEPDQYPVIFLNIFNTGGGPTLKSFESRAFLKDQGVGTYTSLNLTTSGFIANVTPGVYRLYCRASKETIFGSCLLSLTQVIIQAIPN